MEGKIIKSNKWGRGIHSPFAYRLVTDVIFAPYPFYSFEDIRKLASSAGTREELEIIFRLINFFQPENIWTVGEQDENIEKVCNWAKPGAALLTVPCVNNTHENSIITPEENSFIIWNNYCALEPFNLNREQPLTFIIRKINDLKMEQLFEELKGKQGVSVTIELRNFGIVLINGKFQKQNFVINH